MRHIKFIYLLVFLFSIFSCNKEKNTDFVVKGTIKGLTKGTVYLDKVIDTIISPVDSFLVRDNGKFILGDALESPEIYYLRIKEVPGEKLLVFGEKTSIEVQTKLERFVVSAEVTGSENHDLWQEYKKMIQKFNSSNLDLVKASFEAKQKQDSLALDSLDTAYKSLVRRRYLYTTNYAVKHADREVAPYLALTELYNANISLLDTINNSLSEEIKNSKYGKQLDRFITVIRKNEN